MIVGDSARSLEMVNSAFQRFDDYLAVYENANVFTLDDGEGFRVTNDKPVENADPASSLNTENSEYQILPKEFFKYRNVPRPLVSRAWLRSVYDERETTSNSDEEDSLPLSDLKQKFVLLQGHHPQPSDDRLTAEASGSQKTPQVVKRRRGRPRKQELPITNTTYNPSDSNFLDNGDVDNDTSDNDADWWSNGVDMGDGVNLDSECQTVESKSQEESVVDGVNIKTFEEETDNRMPGSKRRKTKERSKGMTGIKIDNSKHVYPCLECGKTFSAACTLKYHLRIHNGTLIKCQECGKGFTTNYLLKCHMRIHTGDLFICHKCGRGFTTAELLKVHNRSHTGVRPYPCNICGKFFPSASNLTQHKGTHEQEKKYLCSQCGSSFSQKRTLDGHMLSHGEKNHACTVCGKLWARKSDLREHMRVHTGYKPYACSQCPQKFTQASSLKRHQIIHRDAIPVQCLICGKMFKCDEYYKRHMKKHKAGKDGAEDVPIFHDFGGS